MALVLQMPKTPEHDELKEGEFIVKGLIGDRGEYRPIDETASLDTIRFCASENL